MSATLNEEPKIVPKATAATELSNEENSNGNSNGPDKSPPEKEIITVADKTIKESPKIEKNIQEETPVKDATIEEVQSNLNEMEVVKEKMAEHENSIKEPILEEAFKEKKVEPVESLKDIADSAKSVIQKVADKEEEKFEKGVEKEEKKDIQKREIKEEEPIEEEKLDPVGSKPDKTKKESPIFVKNIQEEIQVKDAKIKEVQSNKNDMEGVKEKNAKDENSTKAPILEEAFKEEKVEPVESLKDIADSLNAAAKSVIQKVANKVEENIEQE